MMYWLEILRITFYNLITYNSKLQKIWRLSLSSYCLQPYMK